MKTPINNKLQNQLKKLAQEHNSSDLLEKAFSRIGNQHDLVRFLYRYVVFNGYFAGGVSNLAGEFHIRHDLFRDAHESIADFADKSSEIASYIYAAAEDEYFDRHTLRRVTHRELAKAFMRVVLEFYGISPQEFETGFVQKNTLHTILNRVKEGYLLDRQVSDEDLLRGIGFHLGSELLAHEEFNLIDAYLKANHQALVAHLKSVVINHHPNNAYEWLQQHTYVEEDHFNNALVAGEKALMYYAGNNSKDEVFELIITGFLQFASVQQDFFEQF